MYGTSQKSFLEQGTAKIIIQHSKTVDETKMGARSRNINAIYIENSDGERFKFANNYLPGARAMARHVSNEGHTRDDRGGHIVEIMQEMNDLKTFVRAIKREDYVTEEQKDIIDAATDRYYGLKDTLKNLASANGYQSYFENWEPSTVQDEGDIDDLKEKLTRSVFDDRLESALPAVRRAMEQRTQMREANDEEALKMAMNDEPIEIFDNEAGMAEIKNYMQYIKNSDMEAQRKNMALVVAIVKFLVNNATDDNLANAMSEFDVENKKHMAAGYALAKKFIQGKYEIKQKAAKKDLYGKDKNESVTFESFEQSMDMIAEGTWHLFSTEEEIKGFIDLLKQPLKAGEDGEDAINAVMKFVGDDDMLDDIAEFVDKAGPNRDARPVIIKWLKKNQYGGRYRYPEQYIDAIKAVLAGIKGKAESVKEAELEEGQVLFRVKDENGEVYEIEKDIHGELVAFDANAEQEAGGGMGPYDYYQDTGIIDHPIAGKLKTMKVESVTEMKTLKCKHCGDMLGEPTTDCPHDSQDPSGENWIMVDVDNDGDMDLAVANEGKMSDLQQHIKEMIADGASNEEIKKMHPGVSDRDIASIRKDMDESVQFEEVQEVDEAAESIAKLKAMAGVGSKFRSNHGIHEGEEGYQLTPRSIVARQMRKLQDIEKN